MPMLDFMDEGEIVRYNMPLKVESMTLEHSIVLRTEPKNVRTEFNKATNQITNNVDFFPKVEPRRKEPLFQNSNGH